MRDVIDMEVKVGITMTMIVVDSYHMTIIENYNYNNSYSITLTIYLNPHTLYTTTTTINRVL